jgi:hypothetical protein
MVHGCSVAFGGTCFGKMKSRLMISSISGPTLDKAAK